MSSDFEITRDTIIAEILRLHPECIEVFDKHSMPCRTCMGASTGTVAEGCMMHDVDIDILLRELKECSSSSQNKPQ